MVVTLPPTNSAFAAQKNANWSNNFKFNLKKKEERFYSQAALPEGLLVQSSPT